MAHTVTAPPRLRDPAWVGRLSWGLLTLVVLAPLLVVTEFRPWQLFEPASLQATLRFLADFFPPRLDPDFLALVARETWRTVAIATAGMALGLLFGWPLALLSVRALSLSALTGRMAPGAAIVRGVVRAVLVLLRSVPELIWALVFVRVVGLGPTAGVLAIGLTYGGMLGKVYGEILESGEPESARALLRNGSGRMQAFFYGLLPQNAAELTSYTVYRWECAIRSSAVLGFVGAGGLGQQMDNAMKMFSGSEVSTLLIVFVLLVALTDRLSGWLRSALG
ncbi:MAG TPA: ABC transporter permease subunit [Ramlibacter sp.]|uniref:PhnE/PtxC family ABC transporter permease n=1 Tax=Ramlibacter sp. TaxID=1917967 RepID=UPI002D43F15E|nr:ABC transporter permease subunit [Ramlibacter sp.]HZY19913.1 ABC transporter permease subunit [Ramlibacter sp.]